jgi:hypothetical protein
VWAEQGFGGETGRRLLRRPKPGRRIILKTS